MIKVPLADHRVEAPHPARAEPAATATMSGINSPQCPNSILRGIFQACVSQACGCVSAVNAQVWSSVAVSVQTFPAAQVALAQQLQSLAEAIMDRDSDRSKRHPCPICPAVTASFIRTNLSLSDPVLLASGMFACVTQALQAFQS
jgi:hypothetical protein